MGKKRVEIFQDKREEYRARLRAGNGEIVTTTEGYTNKSGAKNWAKKLSQWGNKAPIRDLTKKKK